MRKKSVSEGFKNKAHPPFFPPPPHGGSKKVPRLQVTVKLLFEGKKKKNELDITACGFLLCINRLCSSMNQIEYNAFYFK